MARLFTGIFPPENISAETASLREHAGPLDVRWISPSRQHATIVFIGQVSDDEISSIREALSTIRVEPFELHASGVGAFPDPRRARVLWVGLEPPEPVVRLHRVVDAALDTVRTPRTSPSRPYHPHITVARTRGKRRIDARPWVERYAGFSGRLFSVESFALVRSRTKPEGAEYTVIGRFGLRPPGGTI